MRCMQKKQRNICCTNFFPFTLSINSNWAILVETKLVASRQNGANCAIAAAKTQAGVKPKNKWQTPYWALTCGSTAKSAVINPVEHMWMRKNGPPLYVKRVNPLTNHADSMLRCVLPVNPVCTLTPSFPPNMLDDADSNYRHCVTVEPEAGQALEDDWAPGGYHRNHRQLW